MEVGALHLTIALLFGGVGYYLGLMKGKTQTATDLLETYRHLVDYGRPTKPVAVVKEQAGTVDELASVRIGETAVNNLAEYLARESGASMDRARQEAEKMVAHFETWGQAPTQ